MADSLPYHVAQVGDEFRVTDEDGRVLLACRDERSAEHYSALLTQAYRRGYRQGRRDSNVSQP